MFKVNESTRELMRVHESWWSKDSECLNSHHHSSSFTVACVTDSASGPGVVRGLTQEDARANTRRCAD